MKAGRNRNGALATAVATVGLALLAGAGEAPAQLIPPPDVIAPTVEITTAPKSNLKTHRQSKTVTFEFISDDPAATFTCRIDQSGYNPCISPVVSPLKATKGRGTRHTFFVRSADAAGNSSGVSLRSLRIARKHPYR